MYFAFGFISSIKRSFFSYVNSMIYFFYLPPHFRTIILDDKNSTKFQIIHLIQDVKAYGQFPNNAFIVLRPIKIQSSTLPQWLACRKTFIIIATCLTYKMHEQSLIMNINYQFKHLFIELSTPKVFSTFINKYLKSDWVVDVW